MNVSDNGNQPSTVNSSSTTLQPQQQHTNSDNSQQHSSVRVKEEIDNDPDQHDGTLPSSSSQIENHSSAIVIKKEEEDVKGCTIHYNNHLEFINSCENCRKVSQCKVVDDDDDKAKIAFTCEVKRECIKSEYEQDCGCNDCLVAKNAGASSIIPTTASTENQVNDSATVNEFNQEQELLNQDSFERDTDDSCPTPDYLPPFFPDEDEDEEDQSSSDEEDANEQQKPTTTRRHSSSSSSTTSHDDRIHDPNDLAIAQDVDSQLNRRRSTRSVATKPKCYVYQNEYEEEEEEDDDYEQSSSSSSDETDNVVNVEESCSDASSCFESDEPETRKATSCSRVTKRSESRRSNVFEHKKKNRVIESDESQEGEGTKQTLQSLIVVASLKCWLCNHSAPNKKKLNVHMFEKHKLEQYRCLMHECGYSTHHCGTLTNHLKTAHAEHSTSWPCSQCSLKPKSYSHLNIHFKHFHQQGTFRCGFDDCDFTPTTSKRDVHNHLAAVHRCPVVSCARLLPRDALKKHRIQAHSIKAKRRLVRHGERYYCGWTKCSYRSERLEDVLVHVRNSHLSNEDGDEDDDPGKYVRKLNPPTNDQTTSDSTEDDQEEEDNEEDDDKKESNLRTIVISLRCWLCDRSFKDKFELNDHLLEEHSIDQYRCVAWRCGASFPYRDQLYHHKQSVHKETTVWACDQCPRSAKKQLIFTCYRKLAIHIYNYHHYGRFKCAVVGCNYETTCAHKEFTAHFGSVHCITQSRIEPQNERKKGPWRCKWRKCNYSCESSGKVVEHIQKCHFKKADKRNPRDSYFYEKKKPRILVIESDTEDSDNSNESNSDQKKKTKAVKRKTLASTSSKTFSTLSKKSKTAKKQDKNDQEQRPERPKNATVLTVRLNCPIAGCTEHRPDKFELNAHLLEAHQLEQHRCFMHDCSANFKYTRQYAEHLKTVHPKMDRYYCSKCDYSTKGTEALHVHNWLYHEEGEFGCSHPGCDFVSHTNRQKVQGHQYRHKPLRYKCTHTGCDKAFREAKSLKNHLKNHETGMFEGCPQCGRHFARLDLFKKHLLTHSKTKQQDGFQCGWKGCKYFASQRPVLKDHLIEQHFAGDPKYGKITDRIEMIRLVKRFTKVIRAKK